MKAPPWGKPERPDTILIVDDIPANVDVLSEMLPDFEVLAAMSASRGIELARAERPDLIFLDAMMPEMDGFEACKRLMEDPATRMIPVVIVTALPPEQAELLALNAGAVGFLTKPLEGTLVRATARTHISLKHVRDNLDLRRMELETILGALRVAPYMGRQVDNVFHRVHVSPALVELSGFDEQTLRTPGTWMARVHPDDIARLEVAREDLLVGKRVYVEYRFRVRTGEYRWFGDTLQRVRLPAFGDEMVFAGTVVDIEEKKRLELRLLRADKQTLRLRQLADQAEVASRLAHEINNPLAVVQGFAQNLRRRLQTQLGEHSADFTSALDEIDVGCLRIGALVSETLDLSVASRPPPESVDLREVASSAVQFYIERFGVGGVKVELPSIPIAVHGFRPKLEQLAFSLLSASRRMTETDQAFPLRLRVNALTDGRPILDVARLGAPASTSPTLQYGSELAVVSRIADEHGAEMDPSYPDPAGPTLRITFAHQVP